MEIKSGKRIVVSHLQSGMSDTGLDYEKELKGSTKMITAIKEKYAGISDDQAYLLFRNAVASQNSYSIVDVQCFEDDLIYKCVFMFTNYEDWDTNIFNAGNYFNKIYQQQPNIFLANSKVLDTVDLFMSKKLIKDGMVDELKKISEYICKNFTLQICQDDSLEDHHFALVRDDQANFVDGPEEMVDELQ